MQSGREHGVLCPLARRHSPNHNVRAGPTQSLWFVCLRGTKRKWRRRGKRCSRANAAKGAISPPGVPPARGACVSLFLSYLCDYSFQQRYTRVNYGTPVRRPGFLSLIANDRLVATPPRPPLHPHHHHYLFFFLPPHMCKIIIRCFQGSRCPLEDTEFPLAGCTRKLPTVSSTGAVLGFLKISNTFEYWKKESLELCILAQSLRHFAWRVSRSETHRWREAKAIRA